MSRASGGHHLPPGPLTRGYSGGEGALRFMNLRLARLVSGHRPALPGVPALRGLAGRGPHHALPTGLAARGVTGAWHGPGLRKPCGL
jgi:hypothetical protein